MTRQGRQSDGALLPAAAGQPVALHHLLQQRRSEGLRIAAVRVGSQAAQVGEVGGGPGGATAGAAAAAWIGEEGLLKAAQPLLQGGIGCCFRGGGGPGPAGIGSGDAARFAGCLQGHVPAGVAARRTPPVLPAEAVLLQLAFQLRQPLQGPDQPRFIGR